MSKHVQFKMPLLLIVSMCSQYALARGNSQNFNILLQFSKYPLSLICELGETDEPLRVPPSPDSNCLYTIKLPVGSSNTSRYPTHNVSFGIDLTSSTAIINIGTVNDTLKCGDDTDFKASGCYVLDDSYIDCAIFEEKGPCSVGWLDALLFNHSYDYMPSEMIDGTPHPIIGAKGSSQLAKSSLNSARLPFLVPSFGGNKTYNLLGLSPKSSFEEFVKNIYTVKKNEFTFVVTQELQLEIQPNLLSYNFIFEQSITDTWQIENMTVGNMEVEGYNMIFENGTVPVCISLTSTVVFAVKDRDQYVRRLMTLVCNYDQCEYNDENIKMMGYIVLNYTDSNYRDTEYMLRLSADKFAIKRSIMGKDMIELNIADIDNLIKKQECPENANVALGISFFQHFMFQFVYAKKANYLRFYDQNNGLSIREKFHLLNFGGFLTLLVMLAISIRVAYKYI